MPLNRPGGAWVCDKTTGRKMGICELLGKKGEVPKPRLKGQPPGHASFPRDSKLLNLGVVWPAWEIERREEKVGRLSKRGAMIQIPEGGRFVDGVDSVKYDKRVKDMKNFEETDGTVPLTKREEEWLQKHHGGMEGLMRKHGLKTQPNEELLVDFRKAVRTMIARDGDG